MGEQERSPEEPNRHSQESKQQTDQNGFIKNPRGKLYLPESYLSNLSKRKKKSGCLLSIREKTAWDWLQLIFVPTLITLIAGGFTLYTNYKQNQILAQREEAEKNRNQQTLLIEYLDEISWLVEQQLLNLNDDDNSGTQRTIARARTLSVLRALDSDRKGELIQFLSSAQLIEQDKPIINLNQVDLTRANLTRANLTRANLTRANLTRANLREANLRGASTIEAELRFVAFWGAKFWKDEFRFADLERTNLRLVIIANLFGVNLEGADLWGADLQEANLEEANLEGADFWGADLQEANLEGADLRRADFWGANLKETNLERVDLWEAELWETNFEKANFKEANLKEADLRGANLKEANFEKTDLKEANFERTDLKEANFERANFERTDLKEANFERAKGLNPKQIKSACNWKEATFSKEFRQKLDLEPDQEVDCSRWNHDADKVGDNFKRKRSLFE